MAKQQRRALPDGAVTPFEGKPVRAVEISVRKTGSGLEDALEVLPVELHQGEEHWFVVRTVCVDVAHPNFDTLGEELIRKHTCDTTQMVLVVDPRDVGQVAKIADRQEAAVRRKREQELGIQHLAGTDGDESE